MSRSQTPVSINITRQLDAFLGPRLVALLQHASAQAQAQGATLYLVGGSARDLLLGQPRGDLDLAVEGDAIRLAQTLTAEWGGQVVSHAPFGTATLTFGDNTSTCIDLVTTRCESYPQPAALPIVEPATLRDDMFRRDFTVNALAICLAIERYGQLYDFFGGLHDLDRKLLRVLHDDSFVDDPTRILRGVRIAARLGFVFEPHTHDLALAALNAGLFERTTPQRLANELRLLFHEPAPERAIELLDQLGALPHLLPGLGWSAAQGQQFAAARAARFPGVDLADVYFAIAAYPLTAAQRAALIARYRPSASVAQLLRDLTQLLERLPALHAATRDSQIDRVLRGLSEPALRAAQVVEAAPLPGRISRYLDILHDITLQVNGDFLRACGLPPGPVYRALLAELRAARLDGTVQTHADEERWVRARIEALG